MACMGLGGLSSRTLGLSGKERGLRRISWVSGSELTSQIKPAAAIKGRGKLSVKLLLERNLIEGMRTGGQDARFA